MRHHALQAAPHLRQARLQLVEHGICPASGIDSQVVRSWQRSLSAGLSPIGRIDCTDNLTGVNLQRARNTNHDLIRHSEPVMDFLFERVRHSNSMVILADSRGVLMHTLGDLEFLNKAERVALMSGASWAENQRGTNAIGTALAEAHEVEIHGAEHYLDRNGFLTCAAAPILSAQGQLLGILDISGDHRSRHSHTLGLVSTAAQMIETSLVMSSCKHQTLVKVHPRAEGIGSVGQGVLVFSEDGWLVGANRNGLSLLQLTFADIAGISWAHLFDEPMNQTLADPTRNFGGSMLLHTQHGAPLYAQVQSNNKVPHSTVIKSKLEGSDVVVSDALTKLDTGDAQWRMAADRARKVFDKGIPLLVTGESGVGKELFAQAVHQCSERRNKPFVAVNCAAFPEHLVEAELFGYMPGAFTGASRQGSKGRIREANGGTLFLDEIGDMPLSLQTRLLRVLQERQVIPLGCGTAHDVDFNLICATHQNLPQAVELGQFRTDLFYRINGLNLRLPALRERTDYAALCQRMLKELSPHASLIIAPELMNAMLGFHWPGNLRQMSHVLRTAVALLDANEYQINWMHLPDDVSLALQRNHLLMPVDAPAQNLHELSLKAIQLALENTRGNVSAAARQLGISRQTLYRKLQQDTKHD